MKIGFVVDKISFGGGERILKMLIDEFFKLHHDIYIYTWNIEWLSYKEINYNVEVLNYPPIGFKKLKSIKSLKNNLRKTKPDCLIVFSLGLAEVAVWAARIAKVPIILSERVDPKYLPKSKFHRFLKFVTYRWSDGIVFQTEIVKNYFLNSIRKKGIVIPNPIMDDNLPKVDVNSVPRKEIVAVGRLSEEKNFELLIRSFSELNLPKYKLHIYGDGPLYNKLQMLISSLGKEDSVVLEGNVDRVIDYINGADIFVMTSNHEGMPNALIEAMAMGLACISTDFPSGSAKELIINNQNGIIIPCNDGNALKEAIMKLVDNTKLKQVIKSNAQKICETNSKDVILPQWVEFIMSVISQYKY